MNQKREHKGRTSCQKNIILKESEGRMLNCSQMTDKSYKQTNRQTDKQTNRQTNKQTNRQTNKQTDRQTDMQTD